MDYQLIWFVLLGILLAGYAILDGFDLGVGILHPLARSDEERRLVMSSIGPIWDGNEVWLITFGGALFAAFPEAYATIFSAFYTPFMLLLFCLIFRAVSLEFRSKVQSAVWRRLWDFAFFAASLVASFLFGVTVANGLLGIPLNERGEFIGGIHDLLGPYAILVGLLTVAMLALHGGLFLHLKTAGSMQKMFYRWIWHAWGLYLVLWNLVTMYTLVKIPRAWRTLSTSLGLSAVVSSMYLRLLIFLAASFSAKSARLFSPRRSGYFAKLPWWASPCSLIW